MQNRLVENLSVRKCFTKKSMWVFAIILIISMIPVQSVVIYSGVQLMHGANVIYSVETQKDFNWVEIGDNYVLFNNTANFSVTSTNPALIEILYLHSSPGVVPSGTTILSFNATVTGGVGAFSIGIPRAQSVYDVYIDNVLVHSNKVSTASGKISFSHIAWSEHTFDIVYDSSPTVPFSYLPINPTDTDNTTFEDETSGWTDMRWSIDDETESEQNYSSGTHTPFNLSYEFNISNIYDVELWTHNDTYATSEVWNTTVTVDRNVTYNTTGTGAGINYVSYHLNDDISAYSFSQSFGINDRWWIHKYNITDNSWDSYWVGMTGDNFTIRSWDVMAVVVDTNKTVRVNTTELLTTSQLEAIPSGYNYFGWSNNATVTLKNLSIGMQAGDWVYMYNTSSGSWDSYWVGNAGDDPNVYSYDAVIMNVAGSRIIVIG